MQEFMFRRAKVIEDRIGSDTITLPEIKTATDEEQRDFESVSGAVEFRPLMSCTEHGFSTRESDDWLDHLEKAHGRQFPNRRRK